MIGFRPAFWPTLIALPMLIVLLALGTWQVQRLAWKNQVIRALHDTLAAEAVELPQGAVNAEAWAYRRVRLSGRFDHAKEIHLLAPGPGGRHGYRIIAPLLRARADGGDEAVLVDRGWVPASNKAAATRKADQIAGEVSVNGMARAPWRAGWFVPANDAAANLWFDGDVAAMQRAIGVGGPELFVVADDAANPLGLAAGGRKRIDIPNPHLQYAMTWYALAVALAAIYVLWHRRRAAPPVHS